MSKNTLIFAIVLGLGTLGCANGASFVRKDAVGGRLALHGGYMPAMADARLMMAEHCQGPVDALERGANVEFRCRGNAGWARTPQELAVHTRSQSGL